jgi:hypothetical protein
MYQRQAVKLLQDEWPFAWSALNAAIWRYWKRHALSETDNPNVLLLLDGPRQIYLVRTKDIETEMCNYSFFLTENDFRLFSGDIVLQSLIDGITRISLSILPIDTSTFNLSDDQMQAIDNLPSHQQDFLLATFNSIVKWLPSQSSKRIDANELFLQSPDSILQVIHNIGKQFERLPSTYANKGEEDLRDHFLLFLEPLFRGSATGETFNKSGKTDILLRADGKNIFIAECKFWRGEKGLSETVNQLLRYLTWRDTNASAIIFVRNKSFSLVLTALEEAMPKHSNYLRTIGKRDEMWLEYELHINEDRNRAMRLTILLFHIPQDNENT